MQRTVLTWCTALSALGAAAPSAARADERANTISIDPISGAVGFTGRNLGEWAVSYERRLAPQHAILVEQTTVHVHHDPWHLTLFGLGAGYRYFLREAPSAPFAGVIAAGKLGRGRFGDMPDNGLGVRGIAVTAHAGWRWIMTRGFTVTLRLGAGWAHYMLADDAPAGAAAMQDDRLAPLPFELDSELAVGWTF